MLLSACWYNVDNVRSVVASLQTACRISSCWRYFDKSTLEPDYCNKSGTPSNICIRPEVWCVSVKARGSDWVSPANTAANNSPLSWGRRRAPHSGRAVSVRSCSRADGRPTRRRTREQRSRLVSRSTNKSPSVFAASFSSLGNATKTRGRRLGHGWVHTSPKITGRPVGAHVRQTRRGNILSPAGSGTRSGVGWDLCQTHNA